MANAKQSGDGRTILGVPARTWLISVLKHVAVYAVILTVVMLLLLYANR